MHGFKHFAAAMFAVQSACVACDGDGWEVGCGGAVVFGFVVGKAWSIKVDFPGSGRQRACFQNVQQFFFG